MGITQLLLIVIVSSLRAGHVSLSNPKLFSKYKAFTLFTDLKFFHKENAWLAVRKQIIRNYLGYQTIKSNCIIIGKAK